MTCGTSFPKKAAFTLLGGVLTLLFSLGLGMTGLPVSALSGSAAEAAVKYVTPGGAGAKNGSSWANAYGEAEFPAAIQSATAGDEFWVAAGAYRPSVTNDADATFTLKNGVALYGGFAGTETARTGRNPSANVTVLTGDLANDDAGKVNGVTVSADQIQGTNSKTVVTADNSITDTTVLDGFTVTAGSNTGTGDGGGMRNNGGSPTITNCTFAGNTADYGGGMYNNSGNPTVTNCTFSGNRTGFGGGGMGSDGTSSLTVTGCVFFGNTATGGYGGGLHNAGTGTSTVTDCAFTGNNAAGGGGGGMYNGSGSPTVTGCTFSGNTATGGGSGMFNDGSSPSVTDCLFADNATSDVGGGIYNGGGSPSVTGCTFSGNSAANGGGMCNYSSSSPTVTNCTFSGNTATDTGGGMHNTEGSTPTVANCTFTGNTAAGSGGGGMYNAGTGTSTVTGCTFSENSVTNSGGGVFNVGRTSSFVNCTFANNSAGEGGGVCSSGATTSLVNCTLAGNTATNGKGLHNMGGTVTATNCIFWNVSDGEISTGGVHTTTVTYSVVQGDYAGTGNVPTNPNLGAPADNGGTTKTCAISATSSAVNAGTATGAPATDQRGVSRPQGAGVDIGAYEYTFGKLLSITVSGDGTVSRNPAGTTLTPDTTWEYTAGTAVTLSADAVNPWYFAEWSGDASGTNPVTTVTMSEDKHVTARFARKWTIVASADANGIIAPAGNVFVLPGADQTFTVTPDSGYTVADVTVDGVSAGTATTYTFLDVSADHTIAASFIRAWTITASAGPGGSIAPAGSVTVHEGSDKIFTISPDAGYTVDDVTVDGASAGAVATYTFLGVSADHTIAASFDATSGPTATPTPTAAPTVTPTEPTATPTSGPTPTPTGGPTPSPFPSPDPDIPLPEVTLTLTLLSGGTILAGPVEITDPGTLEEVLASFALLSQVLAFDPDAIAAGEYNLDLVRFFSILAQLDPGVTELVLLLEVTTGAMAEGYTSTVFLLARTFDDQGNPTGYTVLPREEGTSVFRRSATTETWRVAIADGGATDGDPEAGRVLPNLAAVVAVVRGEAPTGGPTGTGGGGGGGCDTGTGGGNGVFGGALPVLLLLAGPLALLLRRSGSRR